MTKLGVNIDHIATIRQQRKIGVPSIVEAAKIVKSTGVKQITVHLREDRRHIQDEDVLQLRKLKGISLNLEMATNEEIVNFAVRVKPDEVCIVPERRQELTTEGGLNLEKNFHKLKNIVSKLRQRGILVSLFIEPEVKNIKLAKKIGADAVELHTGKYSLCKVGSREFYKELDKIRITGKFALYNGLILNAGHGLDYQNVKPIAKIEGMNTLNIGFSIVARAIVVGLKNAVEEMLALIS